VGKAREQLQVLYLQQLLRALPLLVVAAAAGQFFEDGSSAVGTGRLV